MGVGIVRGQAYKVLHHRSRAFRHRYDILKGYQRQYYKKTDTVQVLSQVYQRESQTMLFVHVVDGR